MVDLGKINRLQVVKLLDFGVYVDGGIDGEILMPKRYVPENCQIGDWVEGFVYLDSEDRPVVTTERPFAKVGECAFLKVVSVTAMGAFLDWGLMKDLLVPFREQKQKMEEGNRYIVRILEDEETARIIGSAKVDRFLDKTTPTFEVGEKVDLLIFGQTDLGYKAIINHTHSGVLYRNEVFQELSVGQKITGYINKIREDFKIDLILHKPGYEKVEGVAAMILQKIKQKGGFLPITDKSDAELIYNQFGISKKTYKKAIGDLYRQRLVVLEENGVRVAP
jgi:uncharacterized protein